MTVSERNFFYALRVAVSFFIRMQCGHESTTHQMFRQLLVQKPEFRSLFVQRIIPSSLVHYAPFYSAG